MTEQRAVESIEEFVKRRFTHHESWIICDVIQAMQERDAAIRAEVVDGIKRVVYGVEDNYPEEMDAVFDGLIYAIETWVDHTAKGATHRTATGGQAE